ncbi:hypothetical protein WG947_08805 [Pontibacter sp. H259]|uniref:hypothetical protein n=1 Tax=Pontibacter sp. H259 TaxID=3133421 RepID=UPI0030BE3463
MIPRTLRSIVLMAAILYTGLTIAQPQPTDSVKQEKKWFVPDAAVLQFAGNTGMLAIGPGYDFANEHLAADLLYGYVPEFDADEAEHLLTLKGTYKSWHIERRRNFEVVPFQVGLGLSYYFNDKYPLYWDDKYPKQYYWWSPKVRLLGFVGASVSKNMRSSSIHKIGLYSELGTYDLILTSWVKEEGALQFWDIVNVSLGARVTF